MSSKGTAVMYYYSVSPDNQAGWGGAIITQATGHLALTRQSLRCLTVESQLFTFLRPFW